MDNIMPSRSVWPSHCCVCHHVAVGRSWELLYPLCVILDSELINQSSWQGCYNIISMKEYQFKNRECIVTNLYTFILKGLRPWWCEIGNALGGHGQLKTDKSRKTVVLDKIISLEETTVAQTGFISFFIIGGMESVAHNMIRPRIIDEIYKCVCEQETVDHGMIQLLVYVVLSICCTWWTQCLVCAVLCGNSWSWHGEIEKNSWTLYVKVMEELKTRKRENDRK